MVFSAAFVMEFGNQTEEAEEGFESPPLTDRAKILLVAMVIILIRWGVFLVQDRTRVIVEETPKTSGDNDDDPRDIPPPALYGEKKIEIDPLYPLIYILSDFHIGNNEPTGDLDKSLSNDMDKETLDRFMEWLVSVDQDAFALNPNLEYHVVMNGDFLDLWQAKRPQDDTMANRLDDILNSNGSFFNDLGKFIRSKHPRMHFHYLIGNHDDALYPSADGSHQSFQDQVEDKLREEALQGVVLPEFGRIRTRQNNDPMNFIMEEEFTENRYYNLHVEHGHRHDVVNWKGNTDSCAGQKIAEHINRMQEMDPAFRNIEFTPNAETAKYLHCLRRNHNTTQNLLDEIETLKDMATSAAKWYGGIMDTILTDDAMSDIILDEISPSQIRSDDLDEATEIIEDSDSRVHIVVFGHNHERDLQPHIGKSDWAYANTGTWLKKIQYHRDSSGNCVLRVIPSELPYVKISKDNDPRYALVELKFFRDGSRIAHRVVRVS